MLDETWGLSNKTRQYEGRYSKYAITKNNDKDMAVILKQKFGKGTVFKLRKNIVHSFTQKNVAFFTADTKFNYYVLQLNTVSR